jgi:ankyrin repeat protein
LGADVDQQGINGYTPLHSAIQSGNAEVIRLLLAAGADINLRDGNGRTPLDLALAKNPMIAELLEQAAQGKQPPDHD